MWDIIKSFGKVKQVNIALLAMIRVFSKIFEGDAQLGSMNEICRSHAGYQTQSYSVEVLVAVRSNIYYSLAHNSRKFMDK